MCTEKDTSKHFQLYYLKSKKAKKTLERIHILKDCIVSAQEDVSADESRGEDAFPNLLCS